MYNDQSYYYSNKIKWLCKKFSESNGFALLLLFNVCVLQLTGSLSKWRSHIWQTYTHYILCSHHVDKYLFFPIIYLVGVAWWS